MDTGFAQTLPGAAYLNFCILTTAALLIGLTVPLGTRWPAKALRAALYALTSGALFLFTFPAGPNLFVDLRLVPLAVAAYRLGPGWALLAALPVTLYRISLGGPALPGTLMHLALVLLMVTLLRHHDTAPRLPLRENLRRALLIFALPALTIFPTFINVGRDPLDATWPYLMVVTLSAAGFSLWLAVARLMSGAFERSAQTGGAGTLDLLTGLPNRVAFERDHLPRRPGWADQYLLLLDLDRFKDLNDQRGHESGDGVLQALARVLGTHLPCDGSGNAGVQGRAYRLGGEEFALLFEAPDRLSAQHFADRLRRSVPVQTADLLGLPDLKVTVSGGLVEDGPGALNTADRLMFTAKTLGRNRVLDPWQAPPATSRAPLNQTSPAVSTLRALLQFIAGNDDPGAEPDLQDLLNAAIACVPGAEAGTITLRQAGESVVQVQSGYDDSLIGTRHSVLQMQQWHGNPDGWRAGRARLLRGQALRDRSRDTHDPNSDAQRTLETAGKQGQLQANLLIPVKVQGDIYAELNLDSLSDEHAFDHESLLIAEEFGLWAAAILSASSRVKQALSSQDAALLTLGIALEARDMETQGHTRRVVELSARLGEALGLNASALHTLRQGAALHDLGKLLIPDSILLKPGALTPDEWTTMKTHAALGADLAAQLSDLTPAVLDVIRSHHERWDGRGYPHGLAGEDIPLLARIFSVCDVFDALTSERPYKAAWSVQDALNEIQAQSGRQFDPQVVAAFTAQHAACPAPPAPAELPESGYAHPPHLN
ncbi:HD domain-containing phosphohydrolase [Deinococcus knuensis]|uniref:Diguanylate cyclase n=1 Tax=Deinococcus knuensis TaxID=1837380 RepID=A0ABQ2SKS8_9DEIO|nr:HD domain-containing phosphohydrolase [Deinococcus knuensis]GGS28829.1 hypothetical protein GCM10008961_20660 [Deinococcus knuensis]